MVVHFLHSFNIMLVLRVERVFKLLLKVVFVGNDLLAFNDLLFNISGQLLAVFLLFKFLPVPVDFYVFLVRGDDFVLNLVCTLFLFLFLLDSASVFGLVGVGLNLGDCQVSCLSNLIQDTFSLIDLDVTVCRDFLNFISCVICFVLIVFEHF